MSTCYVSGRYDGEFTEDDLDAGQTFLNHYEATKFEAEALVRKAMANGLPATVYRPGIVVGDSTTGSTQKYDGPYFLAAFLRRQHGVALVPALGDIDRVQGLPSSLGTSSSRPWTCSPGWTTRSVGRMRSPTLRRRRSVSSSTPSPDTWGAVSCGPRLPLGLTRVAVDHVPGAEWLLGLPAEALDYFASPTTYSTGNTLADLEGTGLVCPPLGPMRAGCSTS